MQRVREAAEIAQLDRFIASLPNGYETQVGEKEAQISGGQRQRLAIARAVYKGRPLLVFDEATNALDPATEAAVLKALDGLQRQGRTIVIIAHSPATTARCDQVLKLEEGRLRSFGKESHPTGGCGGVVGRAFASSKPSANQPIDDRLRLGKAAGAELPTRHLALSGFDDLYAIVCQLLDVSAGGGMLPHTDVHRRRDNHWLVGREEQGGREVVGNARRHLGEKIGGRRADENEIGRAESWIWPISTSSFSSHSECGLGFPRAFRGSSR